jgi:manganese/zinc/iron transport system permease protein
MSLLGDAISHAVLPGIALAFILTGKVSGIAIVIGAMALGVLTAFLTETIHKLSGTPEDSSMGVVFTSLFALGVVLLVNAADGTDLDPGCVLYGLIEFAPLDRVSVGGIDIPRTVLTLGCALLLVVLFLTAFWKELKLSAFDPALASAMGFSAVLMHYLLTGMTAGVTVASFEAVGAVLVVAMLIVPAATAQLLTDRLSHMLIWAAAVAILAAVVGYLWAAALDTSVAGMMAVVAGLLFTLAVFLAPRHGVVSKLIRNALLTLRITSEDLLGLLYRHEEAHARGEAATPALPRAEAKLVNPGWLGWLALRLLARSGQVLITEQGLQLAEGGRRRAQHLVRAHRLWEAYLQENTPLPRDHLHEPAMRMEHFLDPELQHHLEEELRHPDHDPHGRQIPPSPGG